MTCVICGEPAGCPPTALPPTLYDDLVAVVGERPLPICWHGHDREHYYRKRGGYRQCADCATERAARVRTRSGVD